MVRCRYVRGRVGQANALALFVEARLASERVTGHGYMIQAHIFAVQQLIELQSIGFDLHIIGAGGAVNVAATAHQIRAGINQSRIA